MPVLTYLHLRKGGNVSLAFNDSASEEWQVRVADHGEHTKVIYATLLAAYLTKTSIFVRPIGENKHVKDVGFGHDVS